jgi:hypothetical protein
MDRTGPARPSPAQRDFWTGLAGLWNKTIGPGGPPFLSGRPGPNYFFYFLNLQMPLDIEIIKSNIEIFIERELDNTVSQSHLDRQNLLFILYSWLFVYAIDQLN